MAGNMLLGFKALMVSVIDIGAIRAVKKTYGSRDGTRSRCGSKIANTLPRSTPFSVLTLSI